MDNQTQWNGDGFIRTSGQVELIGFVPTPDQLDFIKDGVNSLVNESKYVAVGTCKSKFLNLLTEIHFYKNSGVLQSCPRDVFLEKVVHFIDDNTVTFWECAQWMLEYLINNKVRWEEFWGYALDNDREILREFNTMINENLFILYEK